MPSVLLVQGTSNMADRVQKGLVEAGYQVDLAGKSGVRNPFAGSYDAIVVDGVIAGKRGHQLLERIHKGGCAAPVIMLATPDLFDGASSGFDNSDALLVKSTTVSDVVTQLRTMMPAASTLANPTLRVGDVEMDTARSEVRVNGRPIALNAAARTVLEHTLREAQHVADERAAQIASLQEAVAERERAAQTLREVLDLTPFAMLIAGSDGSILMLNAQAERLFGYTRDELLGHAVESLMPERFRGHHADNRTAYAASPQVRAMGSRLELFGLRNDGSEFPADICLSPLSGDSEGLIAVGVRDITERKLEEQKLHELSARLLSIREEERMLLSRAIHDELGQALTGLKMDVSWLLRHLPPEELLAMVRVEAMTKLIDQSMVMVRRMATELRPAVLDDIGLAAAVEWQLQDFGQRTGVECVFGSSLNDVRLNQDVATTAFRIFQEALTNVARHSSATRVEATLCVDGETLVLCLQDNGCGITMAEVNSPKSIGLLGMRERARIQGGEVQLQGAPGTGTAVEVRLPLGEMQHDVETNTWELKQT